MEVQDGQARPGGEGWRSELRALATEAGCEHSTSCRNGIGRIQRKRRHVECFSDRGRHQYPASSEQDVFDRQRERGVDNIGYSLSRTVGSYIQYKASVALGAVGAVGACSRCRRRNCMAKAMSMFDAKGNHGFPAVVVETLLKF